MRNLLLASSRLRSFLLTWIVIATACGGSTASVSPHVVDAPAAGVAKASPARVVLQRTGDVFVYQRLRILTPSHAWEVFEENGTTIVDADQDAAVSTLSTTLPPREMAFSPDGADVYLLSMDLRSVHQGKLDVDEAGMRIAGRMVLERWDVATGVRRWRNELPRLDAVPSEAHEYDARTNHLAVSSHGVVLTRCFAASKSTTRCIANDVSMTDGALGNATAFDVAPLPTSWGLERVEEPSGKFSLVRGDTANADWWGIFDATGHLPAGLKAHCARFDRDGTLWVSGAEAATLVAPRALGIDIREDAPGPRSCGPTPTSRPPLPFPSNRSGLAGVAYMTIAGDQLRWEETTADPPDRPHFSLDLDREALPERFTPTPEPKPRDGFIFHGERARLFGEWIGGDDSTLHLSLGIDGNPPSWRPIRATARFFPGFALTPDGKVLVVTGGRAGIQRVDVASGALLSRSCGERDGDGGGATDAAGNCDVDSYTGLLPTTDGQRAWTHHVRTRRKGLGRSFWFEELDLATGKVLRTIRTAESSYDGPGDFGLGWIAPDEQFFYAGGHYGCSITTVALGEGEPRFGDTCLHPMAPSVVSDPRRHFVAAFRTLSTVDIYADDGEWVASFGQRRDAGFALARDGRFACRDSGCDAFRCVVDGRARPVTDEACASLRVPGLAVTELLHPRGGAAASTIR